VNTEASRSRLPWIICAIAAPLLVATFTLGWINGSVAEDPEFIYVAVLMMVGYVSVGAVVASRAPRNAVGWLMMAVGLGFLSGSFTDEYLSFADRRAGGAPLVQVVRWLAAWSFVPSLAAFPFIVLLFPDGRVLSPRWRWVVRAGAAAGAVAIVVPMFAPGRIEDLQVFATNPLGIEALEPVVDPILAIAYITLVGVVAAALVSIVLRWRRSAGIARQQIRLFAGIVLLTALLFVGLLATASGATGRFGELVWLAFFVSLGIGVPLTMGVAILRYRMYDVEVVIRKTVRFVVVAVLIVVILGGVALMASGPIVGRLVDPSRPASILAFGIAIGLLVRPLWRLSRRIADRLVFGGRATPYEVLTEFSQRVGESYSTEDVLPRMAAVLGNAVGAERADIWLGAGTSQRHAMGWPDGPIPDRPGADFAPISYQGEELGSLSVVMPANDPMNPSKERLMADLAAQAGPVLRNVRLVEDLRESRRRIVTAQDDRARRLERDIHDGAQQQLVALAVQARLARTVAERDPAKVRPMLDQIQDAANDALENLRDLARGIYPPLLADQGIAAAIEAQARKAALPVTVSSNGISRYPQDVEAAVYFCILEALNNVAKYADATRVDVRLGAVADMLRFEVIDDGRGFEVGSVRRGSGLQGMTDRLAALNGSLTVASTPGKGTTVNGTVPI